MRGPPAEGEGLGPLPPVVRVCAPCAPTASPRERRGWVGQGPALAKVSPMKTPCSFRGRLASSAKKGDAKRGLDCPRRSSLN